MALATRTEASVERLDVSAYEIPTDAPESDGTLEWDSTTIVVVEAHAGGETGLGYTYADAAAAALVESRLPTWCAGATRRLCTRPGSRWAPSSAMRGVQGSASWRSRPWTWRCGTSRLVCSGCRSWLCSTGRTRRCPSTGAAGSRRTRSNGSPSNSLAGSKRESHGSSSRWDASRSASGSTQSVTRFSTPPSTSTRTAPSRGRRRSSGRSGTRMTGRHVVRGARLFGRSGGPPAVAGSRAGRDGHRRRRVRLRRTRLPDLLAAGAVDCLQADVTRCGGITGLLQVAPLAAGFGLDVSAHCAPQISAHAFCAVERLRRLEWFDDHVRVERLLFDGVLEPVGGSLGPDASRRGHGLELKRQDAERYRR